MNTAKGPLLIISWTVFPEEVAMSLLVHQLASAFRENEVIVVGEISKDKTGWDASPMYPLYYIDPFPFSFEKGKRYFKWAGLNKSIKAVEEIIKKHNCSAVLCAFPDEYYMMVAMKVARRTGLPFYPWFHNTYMENRTGILFKLAKRLQPQFFKNAKKVLSISQGLTDYYQQQYPDVAFGNLLHCFNIPAINYEPFIIDASQRVKFAYTGSLNESCRDAAVRLAKIITDNPNYELHVFGKRNAEAFRQYGIQGENITVYRFLPDEEFNQKLKACHIMLLPHGFNGARSEVEYNTIFPTRTIPLLYSNRPILMHGPFDAYLTKFFRSNQCGLVVDSKNKKDIEVSIKELINENDLITKFIKNAIRISKQYDVNSVVRSLKQEINFED